MARSVVDAIIQASEVPELLAPGDEFISERHKSESGAVNGGRFEMAEGPLESYGRTVELDDAGNGRVSVHQVITFKVGVPWFSWLFVIPLWWHFRRLHAPQKMPWWAPPQRLDRRGAVVLATLCALMVVCGYLDDILTETMTYAGADFRVGTTGQTFAFSVVEVSSVLALLALTAADRRGRRRWLLVAAWTGLATTAAGALSPNLTVLTGIQLIASSLVGAFYLLLFVLIAEEMPAGSRAWSAGVVSLCYSVGSGVLLLVLPLAGYGTGGWRWVYVVPLLGAPILLRCGQVLPESRRYRVSGRSDGPKRLRDLVHEHRRRLAILAGFFLVYAIFASPASELYNQFLRTERHFSSFQISWLQQIAGTIGGLGVLVGGRLADTRGRRPVAATGVGLGTAISVFSFLAHGVLLWVLAIAGSVVAFAVGPALAVYGPELFPTWVRSRATGVLTVAGAAGGVIGLVAAGLLSSALGTTGKALAVLSFGPLLGVILITACFPETARRQLEELNPEDAASPAATPAQSDPPARRAGEDRDLRPRSSDG